MMLMDAARSALLVIDVQERLMPAIYEAKRVVSNARILMRAATRLDIPMLVSEQYPKGLGHSVSAVAELAPTGAVLEKVHFSCVSDRDYLERFRSLGRGQAVVCGAEAHVCVLQTVMGLLEENAAVFVVADAVSSRTPRNHRLAIQRMRAAGASIVSTEMAIFEWLNKAGTPEFKELSALIK
ncbi:MAG: isochorismatase family protein [Rhodospirillales bacterium]|nr:isochorismatase family protein [Rhodospirillales bacterium]